MDISTTTVLRMFFYVNESIETKNEAKQNKRNTREKTSWHLQTKRPEDTSSRHLWLVNKGERTSTSPLALGYSLVVLPVTFGHTTTDCLFKEKSECT